MTPEYTICVKPFDMGTDKEAALKPLEEAAAMTSDERREVASALRGDPNDTLVPQSRDGFDGMTYREAAYRFWNMCRRVRDAANVDIAYSTTSVLADLIDPTCEVVGSEPLYIDDETEFILSCGHVAEMTTNEPPAYCPECGARVTGGDGR